MSFCTTATCPHDRGVFIWLSDGPWLGDPSDPDYGSYPWVHDTTMTPGHLEVCELKPFATPGEAGEVCACGHPSHGHRWNPGPIPHEYVPHPCPCGCPDFRHRAGDLERWRAAQAGRGALDDNPGLCARPGCAHQKPAHGTARGGRRDRPCVKDGCRCPAWTDDPGAVMPVPPPVQLDLFGSAA